MTGRVDEAKQQLAEARWYLNKVLDQVGDRWDAQVYTEGESWTVKQVLLHLMITDKGHNNMMMAIARGENTIPDDFDLDRYNRRSVEKRADVSPEQARAALTQTAAEREAWLDTIDDDVMLKQGRHGSMRILTIGQILDVVADHDRSHGNDIAKALDIPMT
jgi:hypothetical protein